MEVLERFLAELVYWSARVHLVGRSRMDETIAEQVLDSYLLCRFAEDLGAASGGASRSPRIADIGAGAGFPGVIWKIARPEDRIYLFERREKPVLFLERAISVLGLEGIEVIRGDAAFGGALSPFDCAISKAAGRLPAMLPIAADLLKGGGWYLTIKGSDWGEELGRADSASMRHAETRELPGKRGVLLAFEETGNTNDQAI
jgi:16S rRNA (guanine527-N7)-methyltransferase